MVHHFKGCSIPLNKYYAVEGKIGEGTFGHVFTGKRLADGQAVAIKRLVLTHPPPTPTTSATEPSSAITKPSETVDAVTTTQMNQLGFPLITLREIKIIKSLPRHENILHMLDMAASGRPQSPHSIAETEFYCIYPLMEHDLAGLIARYSLPQPVVKCLLLQAIRGLLFLHANKIIHRDIKPANILLDHKGVVKLGDFGLARPIDTYGGGKYTPYVLTRWYRAPEVCLGSKRYTEKVDIWSLGCVFGEMLLRHPLLMGRSDMEQITTICNLCGTPTLDNWPDWKLCSPACESLRMEYKAPTIRERFADHPLQAIRFLEMVLALNPLRRPSAEDILMHDYFYTDPLPLQPHEIPHFDRSNELNTKQLRDQQWRRGILD